MFWLVGAVWSCIYVIGFIAYNIDAFESPVTLPVFLGGLVALYGLLGINIIKEWERRPVLWFGTYVKTAGPGLVWIDPAFHTTMPDISVNDNVVEIALDHVYTSDHVCITVLALLTMRVRSDSIEKSVREVSNVWQAARQRGKAVLAEQISAHTLSNLLTYRTEFSRNVCDIFQERVRYWGVEAQALEIPSIKMDQEIEAVLAQKARIVKAAEVVLLEIETAKDVAEKRRDARGLDATPHTAIQSS